MASKSLGTLTLDLIARTGGFVKGMSKAERSSQKWRKQVQRDLKALRGQFATFAKAAAGAGIAAAGAFTILAKEGLQFVDSQAKMATRLGSTIDDLRALQIAAGDFGVEQGQLTSSLGSYTKRLGDAARGTGEAQKAYEALGLEASALVNMPLPEQLALIAERIAQVDSAAERTSIADRLMSGGRRMVNLFEEGGGAIRAAVLEVDDFGLSLSQVDAARVEAANDAMSRIGRATEGVRTQMVVALAPAIKTVADEFNEAARASKGFADTGDDIAGGVVESVSFIVDSVEGLKRTFEVAGAGIVVFGLQSQRAMMKLGETIIDAPVNAVNELIEGLNKISPIDIEPVGITQLSQDLDNQLALIEGAIAAGKEDIQAILMEPLPSDVFGEALERNVRLQDGRDAGLGMEGGISNDAITAAIHFNDEALSQLESAARSAAEALEGFNPAMNEEVQDILDRAGEGSSIDANGILRDAWGNALPTLQRELSAELKNQIGDFKSAQNLQTGLEAAAQAFTDGATTAAAAAWASIKPKRAAEVADGVIATGDQGRAPIRWSTDLGAEKVNQVASQVNGERASAAGGGSVTNRGKVTIKIVDGVEGDVEGEDSFIKQLADVLSGVAAGSR